MPDKILFNNESWLPTEKNLPALIVYQEKSGGSHLTMTFVSNLFISGFKILILTAYPMARENFLVQVGNNDSKITFVSKISQLEESKDMQVIILESGNEALFFEAIKSLSDIRERIILIKNIEVFGGEMIEKCLDFKKIILSGNIDTCVSKEKIMDSKFETYIVFNQPEISFPIQIPVLEKYSGYLQSGTIRGVIKVMKND